MANLYQQFISLIPPRTLVIGEVTGYSNGVATVELPSGAFVTARGEATVGAKVFVRDGVIEGPAEDLPTAEIEI